MQDEDARTEAPRYHADPVGPGRDERPAPTLQSAGSASPQRVSIMKLVPGSIMRVAVALLSVACAATALVVAPLATACSPAPHAQPGQPAESGALRALTPLRVCGRALCAGDERFRWRGVTAFGLADLVAHGRETDARTFIAWAGNTGFNVLRVLAMIPNGGWLDLSPADGRRALPRLFTIAREHGMYVQIVALANTNERSGRYRGEPFLREQVREVGRLCAQARNCVLELANEPYHGSQASLDQPALMRRLQQEVPKALPVAWGAARGDESHEMAGGTFAVVHVRRSGDRWSRIARMRSLAALSAATGKFVVDNEPIGAAEAPDRGRRDSAPEAFFAQGVMSRLLDVGSTFHCEDCLPARVPGPVQRECAGAFIEGFRIVPEDVSPTIVDVAAADGASGGVFSATSGDRAWSLLLGESTAAGVRWPRGWSGGKRIAHKPGVEVWTAAR